MALMAEMYKANEDQHSDASRSIFLSSAFEPPLSPGVPKLSRSLLKRQDSDQAHSFTSRSSTTASPMGFAMDSESVRSFESRGSSASPDSEVRLRGCRWEELSTAVVLERARQTAVLGSSKDLPPVPGYLVPDIMPPDVPPPPRPHGCREVQLTTASVLEHAGQIGFPGSCKDLPPVPGYLAPDIMPPDVPPPPVLPPGTSEFGPSAWKAAVHPLHLVVPKSPSFGCSPAGTTAQFLSPPLASGRAQQSCQLVPVSEAALSPQDVLLQQHLVSVGVGVESCAMHGERPIIKANGLLSMQCSTGSPARNVPSDYDEEVSQALAVLDLLRSGPSVPPLPPSGCYGGVFVSSAISEGLGDEAAGAAEAAAREFGEQPVKVMLPWCSAHAGMGMFDKTKAVKITLAF